MVRELLHLLAAMSAPTVTASQVRRALLLREEIAFLDLRHEAGYATGHPLFAANMAADRIVLEAPSRLPRSDVPIVVYDAGEGLVSEATERLGGLGYKNIRQLEGGLQGWQEADYEIFKDVNSYAKAFGELVESRRHTPSVAADEIADMIARKADIAILDVRRFDEYATMNIPGAVSVPGAELLLRAAQVAPDPETTIVVNCAGRTRSIIGTQSLINAGIPNKVVALRNGTIGWTLAGLDLEHGMARRGGIAAVEGAKTRGRDVAYRTDGPRNRQPPHLVSLRRAAGRRLCRWPYPWVCSLPRRPACAGDRYGRAGTRGANSPDRQHGCPRRHERLLARANGLGSLRARWRLRSRPGNQTAAGSAEAGSVASLPAALRRHQYRRRSDAGLPRLGVWFGRAASA